MQKALTDSLARSIKAPSEGRVEIADLRCTGLCLRVTRGDVRSWCFRFRDPISRRSSRMIVGIYPDVSLAQARKKVDELRKAVGRGENPLSSKRWERDEADKRTFAWLAQRYLTEHAKRFKKSADVDERNLKLHILPKWKSRRYADIKRRDAIALIEAIVSAGTPTLANRVHALISSIFSFAVDADLLEQNPCSRLKKRGAETVGTRVLDDDELRLLWSAVVLRPVSRAVGLALRLILSTGARPGEVAGLAGSELVHLDNRDKAAWIIPADRAKNGREHLVPLSRLALETIKAASVLGGDEAEFLFPSPAVEGKPITPHALAVAMARFSETLDAKKQGAASWKANPPSPHDLRRTLATRLSELRITKEDRDAILNHKPQDVGSRHYDKYEREREKRAALNLWDATLTAILEKRRSQVVPLRRGKHA